MNLQGILLAKLFHPSYNLRVYLPLKVRALYRGWGEVHVGAGKGSRISWGQEYGGQEKVGC